MNRRNFITNIITIASVLSIGGCIADRRETDPGTNGETPGSVERDYPRHPETLDTDAVRGFVAEYEAVSLHNALVDNYRDSSTTVSTNCDADAVIVNYETVDGLYVTTASCTINVSSAGPNGAGTGRSKPTIYLVTTEDVTRIEPTEETYDDPYLSEDQQSNDAYGFWVSNFDDSHRDVTVRLAHREGAPNSVLDRTFELGPGRGVHLHNVTGVPGEYDCHAETAAGRQASEVLEITGERSSLHPMGAVLITPGGSLIVGDISFAR